VLLCFADSRAAGRPPAARAQPMRHLTAPL